MQPLLDVREPLGALPQRAAAASGRSRRGFVSAVDDVSLTHRARRDARARRRERLRQDHARARHPARRRAVSRARSSSACRDRHARRRPRSTSARCGDARRHMQMIFQDPYSSLNPRMTVRDIISEPLIAARRRGLDRKDRDRRRGHRHRREMRPDARAARAAIRTPSAAASGSGSPSPARWCSIPALVVCDEPISSLDVSIQAQILNLLAELQQTPRPDLPLHRPRPRRRRLCLRPGGGDVSRPDRRDRHDARGLFHAEASLYRGADVGGAGARSRRAAPPDPARGRAARSGQPAVRLPLPHPLPLCDRPLRGGRARRSRPRRRASSRPATMPRPRAQGRRRLRQRRRRRGRRSRDRPPAHRSASPR